MKRALGTFVFLISNLSIAAEDLPFADFYGKYDIQSCKKLEANNEAFDYCTTKTLRIEKAPANRGAPHTLFSFSSPTLKFDKEEAASPKGELKEANYKYGKESDGRVHYFLRTFFNQRSYIFTDMWMKKNADGSVTYQLKTRETAKDDGSGELLSAASFELVLKKAK